MSRKCHVLWAEDEETLREIMCELLTGEGHTCIQAADGQEAVEKLETEKFDMVITDFNMPRKNGTELLFWARSHGIHCPFIFVTANEERLPIENLALNDCCATVITKPFQIDALLKEIDKAMERNHLFDCKGKVHTPEEADNRNIFPYQNYLAD